jgi:hypothetical protein
MSKQTNLNLYAIDYGLLISKNAHSGEASLKNEPKTLNYQIILVITPENGLNRGCKTNLNEPRADAPGGTQAV